ncbi:ribonuclease J [Alphaproteobacteria bacterium]|nr:ribonuclease J [Alphaproteobacteria bacterium]
MPSNNTMKFLPLGGAGEIGMNLNLYEFEGQWLMVDLGITFNDRLGVEVLMPNPQYIVEKKDKVCGLLLTHGHEDHIGAIPYLWERLKCPMYATPFTAEMIRHKMDEHQIDIEGYLHEIPLEGEAKIGPFSIKMVTLAHSIPEPNGVLIKTKASTIFHTGDWKIDPNPLIGKPIEEEQLKKIGDEGVDALVCDSTNVFCEGDSGSEEDVRKNLTELIGTYKKEAVFVSCFASNLARLETAAIAAQKNGRQVAILGRGFRKINEIARKLGHLKNIPPFLTMNKLRNIPKSKILYICSGSQGESRAALSRIASEMHPDIKMAPGDVVIFSSRVIPGNEKSIIALKNKITKQGVKIITGKNEDLHVSGHPSRNDLVKMYGWIRPKTVIPVHGELIHMVEQGRLAKKNGVPNVLIPENGTLIEIDSATATVIDQVPSGRLALDGNTLISLTHNTLKERKKLEANGVVSVVLTIDKESNLKGTPLLISQGITMDGDLKAACVEDIIYALDSLTTPQINDEDIVQDKVRLSVQRKTQFETEKKPIVISHVIRE